MSANFAMDMLKDVEVEYVARMDADDICTLDRFEKQIQFLDSHPEIDIVGSQATIFFDDQTGREPVLSDLPLLDKDIKAFFFQGRSKYVQPYHHVAARQH